MDIARGCLELIKHDYVAFRMRAKGTGSQVAFLRDPQPPSPHHEEEQTDPACQQLVGCTADIDSRYLGFMTMGCPL